MKRLSPPQRKPRKTSTISLRAKRKKNTTFAYLILVLVLFVTPLATILGPIASAAPGDYSWQQAGTTGISSGTVNWKAVASSADGTKLTAAGTNSFIYTSTDSGATWVERTSAGSKQWTSIASSADGAKLTAVAGNGGYIYTSTDGGATWSERTSAGARNWSSVASSDDGMSLTAVVSNSFIYTSTDSGATWTERTGAGAHNWIKITSSADGTKLAAAVFGGSIYTSTDSGATWTERTSAGAPFWTSLASSADGATLVAAAFYGSIFVSTDSGSSWTEQAGTGPRSWWDVDVNADGTKIAAAVYGGSIYTYTKLKPTWTAQTAAGVRNWRSVSFTTNGSKLAAVVDPGYVYIATAEPPVTVMTNFLSVVPPTSTPPVIKEAELSITSDSCYSFDSTSVHDPSGLTTPDGGSLLGGVGFTIDCTVVGGSVQLTITLGLRYEDASELQIYKTNPGTGKLENVTAQVVIENIDDGSSRTTIRYTLEDGGAFDEDQTVNGTIVDPIYIGLAAAASTPGSEQPAVPGSSDIPIPDAPDAGAGRVSLHLVICTVGALGLLAGIVSIRRRLTSRK
jgi:photosystem II stability/assembly factor-like uncharacterized protein